MIRNDYNSPKDFNSIDSMDEIDNMDVANEIAAEEKEQNQIRGIKSNAKLNYHLQDQE